MTYNYETELTLKVNLQRLMRLRDLAGWGLDASDEYEEGAPHQKAYDWLDAIVEDLIEEMKEVKSNEEIQM